MTPVDSLHIGDFVVVSSLPNPTELSSFGPISAFTVNQNDGSNHIPMNGIPLMVIAIGLPFIGVYDGRCKFAIDVRKIGLQKVPESYAAVMNLLCDEWDVEEDESGGYKCVPAAPGTKPENGKDAGFTSLETNRYCPKCKNKLTVETDSVGRPVEVCKTKGCDYSIYNTSLF